MKIRLLSLIICLITFVSCLSGCGLFVLDQERYLNEVVASVGDINITKEKLVIMYNNYSSTLINSYGYTKKQAVDYCLNSLINSAILTEKGKNELELTDEQMTSAVDETVEYFINLVANYEEEVRGEWDRKSTIPTEAEDKKATYNEYQKKGILVNVGTATAPVYEIQAVEEESDVVVNNNYVQLIKDFKDGKSVNLLSIFRDKWIPEFEDVGEEALKRIAIFYKGQYDSYKKLTNDEIYEKVLERQLENVLDNAYISALDEKYDEGIISNINTQMIMEEYYRIVNDNKAKYDLDQVGYKQYVSDILSNAKDIYYNPVEGEFFYVSHVLLSFSNEQKALIDDKKSLLEQGAITQKDYDIFVENLAKEIKVNAIDENGVVTDNAYTASEILSEISEAVNQGVTAREKAQIFNKFVYKYGSDPGIQNTERDYVIGIEKDDDLTRSNMVEAFTNTSRDLYATGNVGAISGLVQSDYGYHIIMYTGNIANIETNNNPDDVCLALSKAYTTLHGDKTIFDEILETLITRNDKCEDVKSLYVNEYKAQHQVKKYTDRISDLY